MALLLHVIFAGLCEFPLHNGYGYLHAAFLLHVIFAGHRDQTSCRIVISQDWAVNLEPGSRAAPSKASSTCNITILAPELDESWQSEVVHMIWEPLENMAEWKASVYAGLSPAEVSRDVYPICTSDRARMLVDIDVLVLDGVFTRGWEVRALFG